MAGQLRSTSGASSGGSRAPDCRPFRRSSTMTPSGRSSASIGATITRRRTGHQPAGASGRSPGRGEAGGRGHAGRPRSLDHGVRCARGSGWSRPRRRGLPSTTRAVVADTEHEAAERSRSGSTRPSRTIDAWRIGSPSSASRVPIGTRASRSARRWRSSRSVEGEEERGRPARRPTAPTRRRGRPGHAVLHQPAMSTAGIRPDTCAWTSPTGSSSVSQAASEKPGPVRDKERHGDQLEVEQEPERARGTASGVGREREESAPSTRSIATVEAMPRCSERRARHSIATARAA